jgi:hypothetical protein
VPPPAGGLAPPGYGHSARIELRFLDELKRRNVVRVAILYLIACWLILEPTHVVFHMLEAPVWAHRLVLILMPLVLPAAMLFAWVYEITADGLKPTVEVERRRSIRAQTGPVATGSEPANRRNVSSASRSAELGSIRGAVRENPQTAVTHPFLRPAGGATVARGATQRTDPLTRRRYLGCSQRARAARED